MTNIPLHPDDVLFFHDVCAAMRTVARKYKLPLVSITPLPMPEKGLADRLGDCTNTGHIRLVLRATENGEWCVNPRSQDEVWGTAAHELAHLRHLHHGPVFQEFRLELAEALRNLQEDHKERVIKRLVKMQAARDGEAALGNSAAAEAFATAINRMLIENELAPSDLDYARATDQDPVIEVPVDLGLYKIQSKQTRIAWQESLARVVAKAHLCTFLIRRGSNAIWFVGTKSHAVVAEYAYGVLVPLADKLANKEYYDYHMGLRRQGQDIRLARGFRPAWLETFVGRIAERFDDARRAAVTDAPEGTSVALMRLDGALQKARAYTDDKFKGRRGASALSGRNADHHDGRARGRAAADRMVIGRRGVENSRVKGYIG
jgi:hypothetical protein